MPWPVLSRLAATLAVLSITASPAVLGQPVATGSTGSAPPVEAPKPSPREYRPESGQPGKDVIWVPTPQALVDRMLDMVGLTPADRLFDLGSGDGRTVITAAKRGVRAHGIEYNPDMVALSKRHAQAAGVADRATFVQGDIFLSDFSQATVISLFLLPHLNLKLRPTLLAMPPGTRIVSNAFDMDDWLPDETFSGDDVCGPWCRAYKWVVPARVEGGWMLDGERLTLTQTFQILSGELRRDGRTSPVSSARMDGPMIRFEIDGRRYTGRVDGDAMSGETDDGRRWQARRAG